MPPAPPSPHQGDICLILFAVYHMTANIASQRFRGLLRYIDRSKVHVHVITLPPADGMGQPAEGEHWVNGKSHVQGSWPDVRAVAGTLFGVGAPRPAGSGAGYYMHQAAARGIAIGRSAKAAGQRVVMLGTFDPLDALLAAHRAARGVGAPLLLDFRDGYAHDNLVPASPRLHRLRSQIERLLIRSASGVIAVTRPLCDDFRRRYPQKPVFLLPNGFLPDLRFDSDHRAEIPANVPVRLGHFGRIAMSDQSSFATLAALCDQLQTLPDPLRAGLHLTFMGQLFPDESAMLQGLGLPVSLIPEQPIADAAQAMRKVDAVLLVTGSRPTTATGKFYQYLASGRRIVLVSQVENEASRTLREIGDDDVIHILGEAPLDIGALILRLRQPFQRNQAAIWRFGRDVQAQELLAILQSVAR